MKPIRVLHVLHSLDIGGLENGVINLINTMDCVNFIHTICCISRSGRNASRLTRRDVRVFEVGKTDGRSLLLPLKLARLFQRTRADIVHTRNWGAIDGILGARLARIPIVIHGEHGREISDLDGSYASRNLIRKGLSYFVNQYITVSNQLRDWLIAVVGINEEKVQTIWNGVDTVKFNPYDKVIVRAKYGHTDEEVIIGTVGRLDPVKDQQLLIKAFARLADKYQRLKLLIVGDGPYRAPLEQLTANLGLCCNVCFFGMRMDVPELLKLFDIFVLPSLAEGISNTILEAMATGLPVVATHVGGNPELVVNEETGYLVRRGDVGALATAMEEYLVDPALMRRHGAAGRERAVKVFGIDRMVAQYQAIYTLLAAQYNR
jgi:sugar transferase (PEP-CTERM/EpsH1 system associated)